MGARSFRDSAGKLWTVWAVPLYDEDGSTTVDPELADGWLEFQTQGERRRLAPIPLGWSRSNEEELCDLCRVARGV